MLCKSSGVLECATVCCVEIACVPGHALTSRVGSLPWKDCV